MWGPRWAAQIAPTVFVWCPFTPCGTQSSFAPWLPSGTMRFKWSSGIWDPCGQPQIYPKWASGIWDPCGQPQIYPMWASSIWDPCGKPQIYPMWASGIWDPCWKPQIYPMWASGYMGRMWAAQIAPIVQVWCPFSPSGTQSSFAPWHPSGAHVGNSCIIP